MRRIVTISYTGLEAPGGVPRWNRDFHSAFSPDSDQWTHFCWRDFPSWSEGDSMPEWVKAQVLNRYLLQKRLVTSDDVIVVDGFWGRGLEHLPFLISVCHGIWGHVTSHDEVPENQFLHLSQIEFRQRLWDTGGKMVAVSDFIADTMKKMWGWEVPVINTGIDTEIWKPGRRDWNAKDLNGNDLPYRPVVAHGINDSGNLNKGGLHLKALEEEFFDRVWFFSFDKLQAMAGEKLSDEKRADALTVANMCVIPSGYEGNSLFTLETLSCNVPIVAYDVGLPYLAKKMAEDDRIGIILARRNRSVDETVRAVGNMLDQIEAQNLSYRPREWISQFSIEKFHEQWRAYVEALG